MTAPGGGATARRNRRGISLPYLTTFGKSAEPEPSTVRVGAAGAGTMDTASGNRCQGSNLGFV